MIIVTGATGQLGSRVVHRLLESTLPGEIGVSVRDPEKAAPLAALGVRVRRGDFADADSLQHAFEGATQLLVVSSNSGGEEAVAQHIAAIDAARDVGAARVLYTSHQAAGRASLFAPMVDHAATTEYLAEVGMPHTALRHGFYASTLPILLGSALDTGELVAPEDGPISWTTHADLADADALILAQANRFDGETPPLTAADAHDLDGVARVLSELTGRVIRRVVVDDDEWTESMIARGVPEGPARTLLGMFRASRQGEFAVTDPALETLLGRPPHTIRTVLDGMLSAAR